MCGHRARDMSRGRTMLAMLVARIVLGA
ncbi:MAG: hypothetical protein QOF01_3026, partial [Thermomicrobiales bacterium]|nr:hypothetical protein [Thermomicrobiales bacterium]